MLAIVRSIKDRLKDGRGVETDTGKFRRSIRMKQSGHAGYISAISYSKYLRTDRDFHAHRRRSRSTHYGFLKESVDRVSKKELDKLVGGIADALLKNI